MALQSDTQAFQDALDFFVRFRVPDQRLPEFEIVHGICITADGKPYAHAWIENPASNVAVVGATRYGVRIFYSVPLDEFRAQLGVVQDTRYSVLDAARHAGRTGHRGPWEKAYLMLCGYGISDEAVPTVR